jgi:hypothetical protein
MARHKTVEWERNSSNPFPFVTEDGMTWRDALTGEPAQTDETGRLTSLFVLELSTGAAERWSPPMKLPMTPLAWDSMVKEMTTKPANDKPETGNGK